MEKLIEELEKLNPWKYGKRLKDLIARPKYLNSLLEPKPFVDILTGARRVGKTSLLLSLIGELVQNDKIKNVFENDDQYLRQTVESTLYRDLLSYYGIRNPSLLEDLFCFLCDKITTPVSANRISKDLKIDVQTAQFYLQYLQDVYLVYPLYKKGMSNRIVKSSLPKYYVNDTGILRLFSMNARVGHLVENLVFTHLRRQAVSEHPKLYYDIVEDQEVDFVFDNKLYEVKYDRPVEDPIAGVTYLVNESEKSYHT